MKRQFRFTKRSIDALAPCPADAASKEVEYSDLDVGGLRLQVNRLGRKAFLFRYQITGRKRAMKIGGYPETSIEEARQKAIEWKALIAKGLDPQERKAEEDKAGMTLRVFVESHLLPHCYATKRSARDDESRLRTHVLPRFGDMAMDRITAVAVQTFHNEKKVALCAATANRIFETLRRAYVLAQAWGLFKGEAPTKGIRLHRELNQRQRYLCPDELKRFMAALEQEPNQVAADAFRLLLATGVRREECLCAKVQDVDLAQRRWLLQKTKNGRSRWVVLNDAAMEILQRRLGRACSPWVFPGKNPAKPLNNPSKAFGRILKEAAIEDFRIHDLRHTTASLAINAGATLYEVQHLLGHAQSATTSRYAHLAPDRLIRTSAQVSNLIHAASTGSALSPPDPRDGEACIP